MYIAKFWMAALTFSMVASEIFPFWRNTSDTVETETPASFATSIMLTFFKIAP